MESVAVVGEITDDSVGVCNDDNSDEATSGIEDAAAEAVDVTVSDVPRAAGTDVEITSVELDGETASAIEEADVAILSLVANV